MSTPRVRLALLFGSLFVAPTIWGAAHGVFPGLSNLTANSQVIIVASIESHPNSPRTNSGNSRAVQRVRVLYVLKGAVRPQDELNVALDSEILFPALTYLEVADFPIYERYVLFMVKDSALSSNGFTMLNAQGSAFWIPREADLSALKPTDVRANIQLLLGDVRKYSESRESALDRGMREYLED
jgi:hypothetical protein